MPKYECKICEYSTNDRSNFWRHKNTTLHKKRTEDGQLKSSEKNDNTSFANRLPVKNSKSYTCAHCGFFTPHSSSYSKHKRRCADKLDEERSVLERLKTVEMEAQLLKVRNEKIERLYKEKENILINQIENFREIMMETKKNKNSVSSLLYEHCSDNPHITEIDATKLNELIKPKVKLIKEIISRFKHRILHKFLGDFIVSVYKKDDIQSQSIFSTDTARMNYMIKELLFDKKSNWVLDKRGVKTSEYIISPVIKHVRELVCSHFESLTPTEIKDIKKMEEIVYIKRDLIEILNDIDDGKLCEKINRYISPLLKMERSKMKKLHKKTVPALDYDKPDK